MRFDPRNILYPKGLPKWFVYLTNISLSPLLLWPLVFFSSIFLFDNPHDLVKTFAVFILMNSYPVWLIALVFLSRKLFFKVRIVALAIPLSIIAGLCYFIYWMGT